MAKLVVGLTGGVGTGKSLVTGVLARLGAAVVDADVVAREVTVKGSPVLDDIEKEFGPGVINPDGTLDRRELARLVFPDPERVKRLNAITHPEIIKRMWARVEDLKNSGDNPIIIINAALLIEAGLHRDVDRVVVVHAAREVQLERIVRRDSISEAEAEERVSSQMPIEEKMAVADYLIDNNGTVAEAEKKAGALYEELVKEAPRAPAKKS